MDPEVLNGVRKPVTDLDGLRCRTSAGSRANSRAADLDDDACRHCAAGYRDRAAPVHLRRAVEFEPR
jgi:hypothetical protein